jgi:RNA polymerase sigma-70 factor, ECF subfamily
VDDVTRWALAAGRGDDAAAAALIRATQADVWRLLSRLGDPDTTDDLVQETYLRAVQALPRFRGDASARTWLLAIARRVAADSVRGRSSRRRVHATLTPPPPVADVAEAITADALLAGLEPDRRTAFVLTQVVGLTYEEAAVVCGCPVGTIRSRVARARADLVALLADAEAR